MATAVLMCRLLQTVYTTEAITARGAKDRICITHVSDLPLSSLSLRRQLGHNKARVLLARYPASSLGLIEGEVFDGHQPSK
jgi:hypothetical protein